MQFLVLLVGVMMFVFYQYNAAPIHFNPDNLEKLKTPQFESTLLRLEQLQQYIFNIKKDEINKLSAAIKNGDNAAIETSKSKIKDYLNQDKSLRDSVKILIKQANPKAEAKDTDYVFVTFIMNNLPIGIIGLLLAVIFSAAMSSTSSEINALATCSVIDIYKRQIVTDKSDSHYMKASQWLTAFWGLLSMSFAVFASLVDNLIEAVNIVGSLFYGTILGIFMVAFFIKKVGARAVFKAAIVAEAVVVAIFIMDKMNIFKFAYLWLNLVGCLLVMSVAVLLQYIRPEETVSRI
jgi:Na+(H+)/acetate symporter ActP